MAPYLGETTLLHQVDGCHDPAATDRHGRAIGPPPEAYRFAYRNGQEGMHADGWINGVTGMHMNQISFAASEGCLVFWSISEDDRRDEWSGTPDWMDPIRTDISSVLDVHRFLMSASSSAGGQALAEQLQYLEVTGDSADDISLFDYLSRQDFYVWAQGCPADDVCGAALLHISPELRLAVRTHPCVHHILLTCTTDTMDGCVLSARGM
jgi:hypothetical protein|eukprot:COSAG02_NODE_1729_length_11180_cov_3.283368_9_plen_209_part_00